MYDDGTRVGACARLTIHAHAHDGTTHAHAHDGTTWRCDTCARCGGAPTGSIQEIF
ncbi:MAG: hypothetical protein AAFP83_18930 [Bacteroidota bacterium]